jgi:hypothetical protein
MFDQEGAHRLTLPLSPTGSKDQTAPSVWSLFMRFYNWQ